MVKDTTYYDLLQVQTSATELEIKKSYRKLAIRYHPDKNPGDEEAAETFKKVSEAYQILSDKEKRSKYDQYGIEEAGAAGEMDPEKFFDEIFGGESFIPYVGELTLLKNLTKEMELENNILAENEAAEKMKEDSDRYYEENKVDIPASKLLGDNSLNDLSLDEQQKLVAAEKKKQAELEKEKLEEEQRIYREEIQKKLTEQLINRISLYTETDKSADVERSFKEKFRLEAENLKMESFGLELLHTIGSIYYNKASTFLKSENTFLGIGGWFGVLKEKGGIIKDTYSTISMALDAQSTMQELAKMAERREKELRKNEEANEEGDAEESNNDSTKSQAEKVKKEDMKNAQTEQSVNDEASESTIENEEEKKSGEKKKEEDEGPAPTDEEVAEMEKLLMGKILAAAWKGSHMEISSNLREVVSNVLYDKDVPLQKRIERAQALKLIGAVFKETQRSQWENEEAKIFEELVAEATQKKAKQKS